MAYNPALSTALDRIKFALGDIGTSQLLSDATYITLLSSNANNEAATIRQAASALATYYATQPSSVSSNGSSVSWSERVAQWNKLALGAAGGTAATTTTFSYTARRDDGYSKKSGNNW